MIIPIPVQARLYRDAMRAEMARLHGLPDRWLAEELLRLSRSCRERIPELANPAGDTYDTTLVWHVVPEAARRLGALRFRPGETTRRDIQALDDRQFRMLAGTYLKNATKCFGLSVFGKTDRPVPEDILTHDPANGNPLAMAVDRLAMAPGPGADEHDWIATQVREAAQLRGFAGTAVWSPVLQTRLQEAGPALLDDAGEIKSIEPSPAIEDAFF